MRRKRTYSRFDGCASSREEFGLRSKNMIGMDSHGDHLGEPVRDVNEKRAGSPRIRPALVIGLTGGIATGKTTVAQMFEQLGARVVSADAVVHELLQPGTEVWRQVVHSFGMGILTADGHIDRKRLADIVFEDPSQRQNLERITHPPVLERLAREADSFRRSGHGVLVLEIPLLVETGSLGLVDKVVVVTAEQEAQLERLESRYGISREAGMRRISSQLPLSQKVKIADWVVSTDSDMESTRKQVESIWRCLVQSLALQD